LPAAPTNAAEAANLERRSGDVDAVLQESADSIKREILVRDLVTQTD
jgi:hypothetical protein